MFPELTDEQIAEVSEAVLEFQGSTVSNPAWNVFSQPAPTMAGAL